jgi:hypothetical protein
MPQLRLKTTTLKYVFTLLLLSIVLNHSFSQTGPGGVGKADGSSHLEFWYIANGESYSNNDLVNSISDRSGNGRTLTANGGERPIFKSTTAGANNMSSLVFNLNQELESNYQANSNENMSFGAIYSYIPDASLNIIIQHGGRNTMGVTASDYYADYVGGNNQTSTIKAKKDWTYHSKTFANSGSNRLKYNVNNKNTDNFTHTIENRTSNTWIGGHGIGGGTGFSGSIGEVYKFSRVLNSAEQTIITNYLSAKYGLTLESNDLYKQDDQVNGNYDHDVAGIGRISEANKHSDSQGTGIVRISNPSNLGDNEFLFWGHDNGTQLAIESTDVPAPILKRFERVWRASEVNTSGAAVDVGTINISFDLSDLGLVTSSDLGLLVDSDNDGFFNDETPIFGATNIGGNIYQFTGVSALQNNLRFTLGTINPVQTPLPIALIDFSVKAFDNKEVNINWQTGSEINNDFFTIERSKNAKDWEVINITKGAGNSSTYLNYNSIDFNPFYGISYYKLKQTDFDGRSEYFEIKSVEIKGLENSQPLIYPNPFNNQITIEANAVELEEVLIYNLLGKNVTLETIKLENTETKIIIDLSQLGSGFYFIKTKTSVSKVIKQ